MKKTSLKKKKIHFMCTAFRDGFQSVFGARVLSRDYMPIVKQAARAGITHIEAGGGACFQSSFFYNNENAFNVMDAFRKAAGQGANLQTLARGVNVVALDSQSSDMIDLHARLFKKHGMTTIRNFDALNDPENLIYSGRAIRRAGLKHELCVAMMSLPPALKGAHTPEFYMDVLKRFLKADIPFDSLCFKDASGTSVPAVVHDTIKSARKLLGDKLSIAFHSHETAGVALPGYMAAIEAGATQIDLSLAPVSGGTCQTDVATMWHALRGMPYELDVDIDEIMRLESDFKDALSDYFIPPESLCVDPRIPFSPMPGGALTANTQMLRDNNLLDKYDAIISAMREVVQKGGFGTSVTPVSQFYFQQAFNNTIYGPWKKIADGYGKMVLGYFGKTPVAPDKEIVQIAARQLGLKPTTEPVLKLNDANPEKGRPHFEKMLKAAQLKITDENVFIAASCGQKGIDFLLGKGKVQVRYKSDEKTAATKSGDDVKVYLDGQEFTVKLTSDKAVVNGVAYNLTDKMTEKQKTQDVTPEKKSTSASQNAAAVTSSVPGVVIELKVREGQHVESAQPLLMVEVMKMQTTIAAPAAGTIQKILVQIGDQIKAGQTVMEIAHD
ncbi:MAG: biotin/lipoyl-binding protein [Lactobacillales bacterium]|jgi:pyruvate carboxylase subunit B|nr:biotin/lipoyl-binding protein [Lactobacillales bacterium]